MASLQNGDKLFVNYCLNCHSANSMRYNKLADLGLTDKEIKKNLLFTGEKVGDLMHVAMRPTDAAKWFGTAPPDLSVIARAKGIDFIYTYLRRSAERRGGKAWVSTCSSRGAPYHKKKNNGNRDASNIHAQK